MLRPSASLHAFALGFAICATIAFHVTFGARLGLWQTAPLGCAVAALPGFGLARWLRARPAEVGAGVDTLTRVDHAGAKLAQGPVASCSQWSGRPLMLLAMQNGRSRPFLIAAGVFDADAFRRRAVPGRRGAQAAL